MKRYVYSASLPSKSSIDRAYKALKYGAGVVGILTPEHVADIIINCPKMLRSDQMGKYVKQELIADMQADVSDIVDEAEFYVEHRVRSTTKIQEVLDLIPDIISGLTTRNMDAYVSTYNIGKAVEAYNTAANSGLSSQGCFDVLADNICVFNQPDISMQVDELARYNTRKIQA